MTIQASFRLPSGWSKNRKVNWFSSYRDISLSEHKHFEWQTDYFGWTNVLDFCVDLIPHGESHAKIGFDFTILGFMVSCSIYDSRHWDYENQKWETHEDDDEPYLSVAEKALMKLEEACEQYTQTPLTAEAQANLEEARTEAREYLKGLTY
jgi:hypothetical protein